jgi:carbon storage regulator
MLILTRREGESVIIGDHIEIRVARIESDSVKLGIVAPRDLTVYRDEVYRRIRDSNRQAARSAGGALPQITLPAKGKD